MRRLRNPYLPGLILALTGLARPWLEASMARHMLLELPLLFLAGWLAAHAGVGAARRRQLRAYRPALLLAALLISGVWMLPLALDYAMTMPAAHGVKVLGMLAAGFLAGVAWRDAGAVMQGFFMVNWAWMTITAGLLYQDAPRQLCSVYLSDQQSTAGSGLVALAATLLCIWLLEAVFFPALASTHES
ncbi:DUF1404 family protein [Janthinobacterium sp.]|uniref:DUF1404 family protein n=1 Tax=Janthinobacterium sp. TaxID=1871054 RepID=UPI00293D4158|nr:DUF1404 family protein [Janthinobacterium sp.]